MHPFAHLEDSLSASKIRCFCSCGLKYFFQYVEKLPWSHVSGAMLLGQAVDVAVKNAVVALKQGRDSVTPQELFLDAYEDIVGHARTEIRWPARYDREKLSDLGERLVGALEPVLLTEERVKRILAHDVAFTVPLLDSGGDVLLDCPLCGVFDILEDTEDGPVPLELKTASSRTQYLPDKLQRDIQALVYGLAAQAHGGQARVRYVSAVKLKNVEIVESENIMNEDQLGWIRGVVVGVRQAIDAGVFVARPSMIECGGCPFQAACARSSGMVRTAAPSLFTSSSLAGGIQ